MLIPLYNILAHDLAWQALRLCHVTGIKLKDAINRLCTKSSFNEIEEKKQYFLDEIYRQCEVIQASINKDILK